MKEFLIKEYINRITYNDIKEFALKEGITLEKEEINIIYQYIKKYYKTFIYGNPRGLLDEIKTQVKPLTYQKIEHLYTYYKNKIS